MRLEENDKWKTKAGEIYLGKRRGGKRIKPERRWIRRIKRKCE